MSRPMHPVALILGSVAYLYSTLNNAPVIQPRNTVIADTEYGPVRGIRAVGRLARPYVEFRGIPYAKPPVGSLRFEPPQPPENWTEVREAVRFSSRCWQYNYVSRRLLGSEDCLYLNVYTHRVLKKEEVEFNNLYPVIVYIHGGLFMTGVSNTYRPRYYMAEDIVLVTINYRLASFGFLNTGDGKIRGNMGLKDQSRALKWVQENIAYFGGDPERVTIVGESAGAVSVHLHMMSQMSKGLFHRAISQSGTALSPWALVKDPAEQAREFAANLECPTNSSGDAMASCLKSKSGREIARQHISYLQDLFRGKFSNFGPSVEVVEDDKAFITKTPGEYLRGEQLVNKVPWINGVNSDEGLVFVTGIIKNQTRLNRVNEQWQETIPTLMHFDDHPDRDNISMQIRDYYFKDQLLGTGTLQEAVDMFSDRAFFQDSHTSIALQSKQAPVYGYYYSHKGEFALANVLMAMSGALPETVDLVLGNTLRLISSYILRHNQTHYGVCHADELAVFYNMPIVAREIVPGSPDYRFSRAVIKLWTSFAKKGKPSQFEGTTWDPVYHADGPIRRLRLDTRPEMIYEPFHNRTTFWDSLGLALR